MTLDCGFYETRLIALSAILFDINVIGDWVSRLVRLMICVHRRQFTPMNVARGVGGGGGGL